MTWLLTRLIVLYRATANYYRQRRVANREDEVEKERP